MAYKTKSMALTPGAKSAKEVVYLQDANKVATEQIANYQDVKIKTDDLLSIIVSSQNPELSAMFNLQENQYQVGGTGTTMDRVKLWVIC
jgi:hypothetical protein